MLTVKDVAERLNASIRVVNYWCNHGYLQGAQKLGRDWIIPESALVDFKRPPMGNPNTIKQDAVK